MNDRGAAPGSAGLHLLSGVPLLRQEGIDVRRSRQAVDGRDRQARVQAIHEWDRRRAEFDLLLDG